ncbi:MAG: integrase arm-type DNA-binding domain-containing protein, partial [Bdellovibrionales bacterium]|nr:integrase arm-type DNA-binding domain-containing protein [Bdellovibrionales bacterium]
MPSLRLTDELVRTLEPTGGQEEFYDRSFRAGGSFGVRVGAGGRRAFFLIFSLHGRRKRITLGRYPVVSLSQARARALEVLRAVADGRDPAAEQRTYRSAATVEEFCGQFIERQRARGLKPSTLREYQRFLERDVVPVWGARKLQDIGAEEISELLERIAFERGSPVMANRGRVVLNRLFEFGRSRKAVQSNPLSDLSRPSTESPVVRALTFEQLTEIWGLLDEEDVLIRALFKVLLLTGQKPGDVMTMRWEDVRLDRWRVREHPVPHEIFLVPQAAQALEELRDSPKGGEDFVFATAPGRPISYIRGAAKRLNQRHRSLLNRQG